MPRQRTDPTSVWANSQLTDRQWLSKRCCQKLCLRWLTHLSGGGLGGKNDSCKDKVLNEIIYWKQLILVILLQVYAQMCLWPEKMGGSVHYLKFRDMCKTEVSEGGQKTLTSSCQWPIYWDALSHLHTHTDTKHTLTPHCAVYPIHQECISQQSYCSK